MLSFFGGKIMTEVCTIFHSVIYSLCFQGFIELCYTLVPKFPRDSFSSSGWQSSTTSKTRLRLDTGTFLSLSPCALFLAFATFLDLASCVVHIATIANAAKPFIRTVLACKCHIQFLQRWHRFYWHLFVLQD